MNALRTVGFHHITMVATNAPRTLAFYGGLLGLPLVKRTVNFDDPSAYHLYFGSDGGRPGTILTFFEWPHARRGHWGIGGVHHLALGAGTVEALLKWKRRLTDAGVSVSGPIDRGYFTSLYFADPDGQVLEIATAGPGYAIDEQADALGQRPLSQPAERLPSGRDEAVIEGATHPEPVPVISDDMVLQGMHHISGITDDIERAGDFYEQALGLRLIKQTVNQDDGVTRHWFWGNYDGLTVAPHSAMTLFDWKDATLHARPGAGQTHHIAFRAENSDEQAGWRDHLLSIGLEVSPILDRTYFESIYFHAPDGMLVEIATDGPGFAVDEPLHQLGDALKLPRWLETQRDSIEAALAPLHLDPAAGRRASGA